MSDAAFWDARYAAPGFAYGEAPNAWLAACEPRLPRGARVLLPADGEGRNAVFLASRGHRPTSLDQSAAGLAKARALADAHGVVIETLQADLAAWTPAPEAWDAVVLVFAHLPPDLRRRAHAALASGLRRGGLLVLEGFDVSHVGLPGGGPRDPAWLFDADALREDFRALGLLELGVQAVELDEGAFHRGAARVLRGVWRAPDA
jgi:hypothetical protein